MSATTSIEWTEATWNPSGCTCEAEAQRIMHHAAERLAMRIDQEGFERIYKRLAECPK